MPDSTIARMLLEQYWFWVGLTQPRHVFDERRHTATAQCAWALGVQA
jgi:hypothetical protein